MVSAGRITHAGAGHGAVRSDTGIQVGDSAAKVVRTYGKRLQTDDHKYQDGALYYYVWEPGHRRGKRYEVSAERLVVEIRGGDESVKRVEGPCS